MHPYFSHPSFPERDMPETSDRHAAAPAREGVFRRSLRAAVRSWQRRKMIAALEALDDRLLLDIGIYRGDIARVVDGFDDREIRMAPLAPTATATPTAIKAKHERHQKAA